MLEELFSDRDSDRATGGDWVFSTTDRRPSLADLALWYQLEWAQKISRGDGVADLTGGAAADTDGGGEGCAAVFNPSRYPGLSAWFARFAAYTAALPCTETRIVSGTADEHAPRVRSVLAQLKAAELAEPVPLIKTAAPQHEELDARNGLVAGAEVSVAPDDTGRDAKTLGRLVALSPEEVVITPTPTPSREVAVQGEGEGEPWVGRIRLHFPRLGFVVRPV